MFLNKKPNYIQRLQQEIKHYEKVFKDRLFQEVPPVWCQAEKYASTIIKKATGVSNLYQYIEKDIHIKKKKNVSILSLGCGACGHELNGIAPLLKKTECKIKFTGIDINKKVLRQAQEKAKNKGIKLKTLTQDINRLSLKKNSYDVVFAFASLHHFIKLDYIAKEINKALKPDGIFITVDIPTKNGYKMWPETYKIVNHLWKILPPKFKIDYTSQATPYYVKNYEDRNHSLNSFECINSEAIIPSLRKHLKEICFVPYFSITRRFFDTKFGPNYDLSQPLDKAIVEFILALDQYYIENKILKPETFFGAYSKN